MCVCVYVCMCVCVSVRSFLPPRASRPRNIGTCVHRDTEKHFNRDFRLKCVVQKLRRHLLASNATNLLLSPKILIPTESTQRGHDITIRDFN